MPTMRDLIPLDRELATSEVRMFQLRNRDLGYRLDYTIVGPDRRLRRVVVHHHLGRAPHG